MSLNGKWYGFGKCDAFDQGVRSFERNEYREAWTLFQQAEETATDPAICNLATYFVVETAKRLVEEALEANDPLAAHGPLASALQRRANFPDLHVLQSRIHMAAGKFAEAKQACKRALAERPYYREAKARERLAEFALNPSAESMDELFESLEGCDSTTVAMVQKYRGQLAAGAELGPLGPLISAAFRFESAAAPYIRLGDESVSRGELPQAAEAYRSALEECPRFPDVRVKLGQVLAELDQLEEAEVQFQHAIDINPKYAEAYAQLGIALKRQKKKKEARLFFLKALELNPYHPIARMEATRR